jgi:hypothetical protein
MNHHRIVTNLATLLTFAATAALCSAETHLTLADFELRMTQMRTQQSVERELPWCIGATGGTNVTFTSEGRPFQIVGVALVAEKSGMVTLIPELFVLRDSMWFGVCHGIRIVKPEPDPRAEAFSPPMNASLEPGHAGDRIPCKKGDTIEIELLFDGLSDQQDADVLVALPKLMLRRQKKEQEGAQQDESTVPVKAAPGASSTTR